MSVIFNDNGHEIDEKKIQMQQMQQILTIKQLRKLFEARLQNEAGFEDKWLYRNRDKYFYPVIQTRWEDWLYVYSLNILEDNSDD